MASIPLPFIMLAGARKGERGGGKGWEGGGGDGSDVWPRFHTVTSSFEMCRWENHLNCYCLIRFDDNLILACLAI